MQAEGQRNSVESNAITRTTERMKISRTKS